MDAASGLCTGCWRTLDEIAAWSAMDNPGKQAVWVDIQRRKLTSGSGGGIVAPS
jgi:predicted Fe-S protein YdhL (DUF1289 family)